MSTEERTSQNDLVSRVIFADCFEHQHTVHLVLRPVSLPLPITLETPAGRSVGPDWEEKLHATISKMLKGLPLGEPRVTMIKAPFICNEYAGGLLDLVRASLQQCFLAARTIDEHWKIEDSKAFLHNEIDKFRTSRSAQTPTTKIPQLIVAADTTIYNADYIDLRTSPLPEPKKVNLQWSPTPPPAVPLPQVSRESSPHLRPSQSDSVVVSLMGGGRTPDIAREAGTRLLPLDDEKDDGVEDGVEDGIDDEAEEDNLRKEIRKVMINEMRSALSEEMMIRALRKEMTRALRKERGAVRKKRRAQRKEMKRTLGKD